MQAGLAVTLEEYAARRGRLLKKMSPNSIAILPAGNEKFRNADTEYPFRQDSDFYYLTGFSEPQALLLLIKGSKEEGEFILFCRSLDHEAAIWIGKRAGPEGVVKDLGANRAYPLEDLDKTMPLLLGNKDQIYYSLGSHSLWDKRLFGWVRSLRAKVRTGVKAPQVWVDLNSLIHELRLIKSPAEIQLMKEASRISVDAHLHLIKNCGPNKMEYELEADMLQKCYSQGCRGMAYATIVAGGANACTLHYTNNDRILKSGDLVLVDAGGEFQNYASDITRTYPVNGKFTEDQKSIYELVLKAQLAAIEHIRPGVFYNTLQETIVKIIAEGLLGLNILKGDLTQIIDQKLYRRFYMHNCSHWLGLDVHDVGAYQVNGKPRALEPGMVLTIEPGIYIQVGEEGVDKRWQGIGIRIEDDVLVTETGCEVLTKDLPKTVQDLENLMKSG